MKLRYSLLLLLLATAGDAGFAKASPSGSRHLAIRSDYDLQPLMYPQAATL
ncbi:hypothetical protein [Cupriavidus sp. IDO]|uniref:hypothetical protein n=1 Tax=Cupriavidus sp. IDO TaxID=1539142 RepID=UPI00187C9D4E|nr:hypothetical protein [Cupriavidus sp. IDO]